MRMPCLVLAVATVPSIAHAQFSGPPPIPPPLVPPDPQTFLAFSAGTGAGAIGGTTEAVGADVGTGVSWAPVHLRLELGGYRGPRWSFGVAVRVGFPLGTDVGKPPSAKAILVRVHRHLPDGLRLSGMVGGGYLRYPVDIDVGGTDSMVAGPALIGAGAGYAIRISKSWWFAMDATALAAIAVRDPAGGMPLEHAFHIEIDVGLRLVR